MLQIIRSNAGLGKYSSITEERRCQETHGTISTSLKQSKTVLRENDGDERRNRGDDAVSLLILKNERKAGCLFHFSFAAWAQWQQRLSW